MTPDWILIGRLEDVPRRGARTVRHADGPPIAVFRTGDDEIFALVDRCPHRGGPLSEGIVSGRSVACPLHSWVIELDSGQAKAPDVGCAPVVPARLEGGRIYLRFAALGGAAAVRWEAA
jgi:nitrite reductase (NADH) small subunit